jgi:membrane-bound lytic murein transglycosylase B
VADGPVLADAVLQPDAPVVADPGNLQLNETIAGLRAKGVDFDPAAQGPGTKVLLVPAETQVGPAYRVGFKNFEVITRYNRSVRYAMAVHDLAQTIAVRAAADLAARHQTTQLASTEEDKTAPR